MKYKNNVPSMDITDALSLNLGQIDLLNRAIKRAYDTVWEQEGPNVDKMYDVVAPSIKTPEEAFYVANVILTDVFAAMEEHRKAKQN